MNNYSSQPLILGMYACAVGLEPPRPPYVYTHIVMEYIDSFPQLHFHLRLELFLNRIEKDLKYYIKIKRNIKKKFEQVTSTLSDTQYEPTLLQSCLQSVSWA
jgi:hypothetical protein